MSLPLIEKAKQLAEVVETTDAEAYLAGKAPGTVTQRPTRIRLVRPEGTYHYRRGVRGWQLGFPYVEGSRIDEGKKPWEPDNFEATSLSATKIPSQNYESYGYYEVQLPEVPGIRPKATITCRTIDHAKKLWDHGNCELIRGEFEEVEYHGEKKQRPRMVVEPVEYDSFTYVQLTKLGNAGEALEVLYGRASNPTHPYWDPENLLVFRDGQWVDTNLDTDFPANIWKRERISPKAKRKSALEETKRFPINTDGVVTVTPWDTKVAVESMRFLLDAGPGLYKALEEKAATIREVGGDPTAFWLTLRYVIQKEPGETEATKREIPNVTWAVKAERMTDEEVAAAKSRDAAEASSETPPAPVLASEPDPRYVDAPDEPAFDMSSIPF